MFVVRIWPSLGTDLLGIRNSSRAEIIVNNLSLYVLHICEKKKKRCISKMTLSFNSLLISESLYFVLSALL